jgi:hypothetical protein
VVKKKCPGGPSNGGIYYDLGSYVPGYGIPLGAWRRVGASIVTNANGSVTIRIFINGVVVDQATDGGVGCATITAPGAVGVRGDNANFNLENFLVEAY